MKTVTKKQTATAASKNQPAPVESGINYTEIALSSIDFSPLNYRKYYSQQDLENFADALKIRGVISPITVRPSGKKFELVAGERRVRAARIAGLKTIPAVIKSLSDAEVREIQLDENMNREDPHPLHESFGISNMLNDGMTIDEVSLRLCKSKAYIYNRMKLAALTDSWQMFFLANKMNIQQAFEIAKLAPDAQQELFTHCCDDENWEDEDFKLGNINGVLNRFHYDLKRAPFNTKAKTLIPEVGACTNCPFNSATLKSLFPEMANEAICSNKNCYTKKCNANLVNHIKTVIADNMPDAILTFSGNLSDDDIRILEQIPELSDLPCFCYYDIDKVQAPQNPDKEEFVWEGGEFDECGYNEAVREYEEEKQEYDAYIKSGSLKRGLYFGRDIQIRWFDIEKKKKAEKTQPITAKEVQEAIKTGEATPEILEAEINRINNREIRAKELDREKVQLNIHEQFTELCNDPENTQSLTKADIAASRLLVFQNLPYPSGGVGDFLFSPETKEKYNGNLFEMLGDINDEQFSYMIRKVIIGISDSKNPNAILGYALYKMAEAAGLDVVTIENEQTEKVEEREYRIKLRISDLEWKIKRLNAVLKLAQAS